MEDEMVITRVYDPVTNRMYFGKEAESFLDDYNSRIIRKISETGLEEEDYDNKPVIFGGGTIRMKRAVDRRDRVPYTTSSGRIQMRKWRGKITL